MVDNSLAPPAVPPAPDSDREQPFRFALAGCSVEVGVLNLKHPTLGIPPREPGGGCQTIPVLSCAFQNYEISETVTRFYQNISQTQKEAEPSQSSETELAVSNRIPECDVFAV